MKIIFLVDGNNKLGMGHVYRSINLAKTFSNNNHKIIFITKDKDAKKIILNSFNCELIIKFPSKKLVNILESFNPDLTIIDKLNETKNKLIFFKKYSPILGIDYTGKYQNLMDYGINILYPKTGIKTKHSSLNYAILNNNFVKTSKINIQKKINRVLVIQGGADTHCFIPKIIEACINTKYDFKIEIIIGPSFKCWKKLNSLLIENKKIVKLNYNITNMAKVMIKSDIVITAAGNTLLECANLGIPSIIISAEKFEIETAKMLEKLGFGISLGYGKHISKTKISSNLLNLINNFDQRKKMNQKGPNLIDGKGKLRILKLVNQINSPK